MENKFGTKNKKAGGGIRISPLTQISSAKMKMELTRNHESTLQLQHLIRLDENAFTIKHQ